jgi:hypothetical protein
MPVAEQWVRLAHVIEGAARHAEEAMRCHTSAALQLDVAQYALTSLVDELAAVMDVGGLRKQATVHVLEIPPTRFIGEAIAA